MTYNCKKHNQISYLIDINKNSQQRIVCQICILQNKLAPEHLKCINEILENNSSSNHSIFSVGENQKLLLSTVSSIEKESKIADKEIESFFQEIRAVVEQKIEKVLLNYKIRYQDFKKLTKKISSSFKEEESVMLIQEILRSQSLNIEEDLSQCIEGFYSAISEEQLQNNMKEILDIKQKFSLEQADTIKNSILDLIDSLETFGKSRSQNQPCLQLQPLISNVEVSVIKQVSDLDLQKNKNSEIEQWNLNTLEIIKSVQYNNSEYEDTYSSTDQKYQDLLQISIVNSQIQISHPDKDYFTQCYLNKSFDNQKNYLIKLQLDRNADSYIQFGLINSQLKDSEFVNSSFGDCISYGDDDGNYTKIIIKGQVHSGNNQVNQKILELRFNVSKKFWRIGTIPNFLDISELQDLNKLDISQQYYFAIELLRSSQVIILDISEVSEFDMKM